MNPQKKINLNLFPEHKFLSDIIVDIENFLNQQSINPDIISEISLCLSEVLTNIIDYAEVSKDQSISIEISYKSDNIKITIIDSGKEAPPPAIPDLPDPMQEHGRGLWLVHTLMNEFKQERIGSNNITHLIKNL